MKRLKILFATAISISFLSGCGESTPTDWVIEKDNQDYFNTVESEIVDTDEENVKILRVSQAELLDASIDDDDFFVFNYDQLLRTESTQDFYSYADYRNCSVKVIRKELDEENYLLNVYFEGSDDTLYGAIFNKDASYNNGFVFTVAESNCLDSSSRRKIDKFERELLASPDPVKDENGYCDLIAHFATIMNKIPNEKENLGISAGAILTIIALVLTIANWIHTAIDDNGLPPHYYDFLELKNRLNDIDTKLNDISKLLTDAFAIITLQSDREQIRAYTEDIAKYTNGFIFPMDKFYRNVEEGLIDNFEDLVQAGSLSVTVQYTKSDDEQKLYRKSKLFNAHVDAESSGIISLENTKKYFETAKKVDEKFVSNLNQDILAAIKNADGAFKIPNGVGKTKLASDIFETIIENYFAETFSSPLFSESIAKFRSLVIDYCRQLYANEFSIVARYVNRAKLTNNFGYEVEKSLRTNLAYMLLELERNAAFAQMVCRFSDGVQESSLVDDYLAARKCIRDAYNSVKTIPSNYCFRNGKTWETKLFSFEDVVEGGWYTGEKRNSFNHSLETRLIIPSSSNNFGEKVLYDRSKNPWVDTITLKGVSARFESQKQCKLIGNISFLDYFHSIPKLINPDANRMLEPYAAEYHRENVLRFIGDFGSRYPANNEEGMLVMVVARGHDPNNPYFTYHEVVEYKKPHGSTESQYWQNGKYYTCDTLNGDTGVFKAQEDLIFHCDYLQSWCLWRNDEFWGMSGVLRYFNKWADGGKGKYFDTTYRFGLGIEIK